MINRKPFYVIGFAIVTVMLLVFGTGMSLTTFDSPTKTPNGQQTQTAVQATLFSQDTIVGSTATAQAGRNATATAESAGPSPTQTLTPTPVTPTLTATPIFPLSIQLGFSDPEVERLEAAKCDLIASSLEFAGNGHLYRLLSIRRSKPVATESFPSGTLTVLMQMDTVHPVILWEHEYGKQNGLYAYLPQNSFSVNSADLPFRADLPFPGEWNDDGKVYFAIGGDTPVQHDHRDYIFIYEIKPDGTVVSHLKNAIPPYYGVIKIERQKDNTLLLWTVRTDFGEFGCQCGPLPPRPFTWIKDKITNDAPGYWDAYDPNPYSEAIGWEVYHLSTMTASAEHNDFYFSQILLALLVHYEAIDQRDTGWQLAQDLVKEAKESGRLVEGTDVDKVFMPAMAQLYESHRAFAAPNPSNWLPAETGFYDRDGG